MRRMFWDREDGGRDLSEALYSYAKRNDVLVLALPAGGVPVALEVSRRLELKLDVLPVRKLRVPEHFEIGVGAVAPGGVEVFNRDLVRHYGIGEKELEQMIASERSELIRCEKFYREGKPRLDVAWRTVILVDDGMATGATMKAAVLAIRRAQASRIVVAVPTASGEAVSDLRALADEVVIRSMPSPFHAIGAWYRDFPHLIEEQVKEQLLGESLAGSRK